MARPRTQIDAREIGPIKKRLQAFVRQFKVTDYALDIARMFIDQCPESDRDRLAFQAAFDEVRHYQRSLVGEIEERNTYISPDRREAARRDAPTETNDLVKRFELLLASPCSAVNMSPIGCMNASQREDFRKWCGSKRYADWYLRAEQFARNMDSEDSANAPHLSVADSLHGDQPSESQMYLEMLEENWNERQFKLKSRDRLNNAVLRMASVYAQKLRLEISKELLTASFAIGDGRTVTWGEATIEDHELRIKLLLSNASGTTETAARHIAAVNLIKASGATRLSEIQSSLEVAA